ncbi:MAG TPA: hypothetical protein VM075_09050 [Anaerolineae bacterium]|nr:hypothetical protein [Anaerolineae bacterium]
MSKGFVCFVILLASVLSPRVVLAQQPAATAASAAVIVEWTTESEVNLAGFNLYRSESPDGPYVKLNETLIPASPDPVTGGSYSYVDTTAESGMTYYYQLEDVELDGKATMHGPIVAVSGGDVVSPLFQASGLLALLGAVLLGVAVLLVRGRRQVLAHPPRAGSGGRGEP